MSATALHSLHHARLTTARELLGFSTLGAGDDALPFTLEALNRLLPEGLARHEVVELVGRRSSGRFSAVLSLLGTTTTRGDSCALVDLGDGFDPQIASCADIRLDRLLWLRPGHLKQALIATETAIQGGFPLVVLDLGIPPVPGGRGQQSFWQRLLVAVRKHQACLLVASPYRVCGTAATTLIEMKATRTTWDGERACHRLLRRISSEVVLEKARGRAPGDSARLDLRLRFGAVQTEGEDSTDQQPHRSTVRLDTPDARPTLDARPEARASEVA